MTKKTKRWLFYSAVTVFLFLSYVVILYAQGYKYSFSEGIFQRTGAISLRVNTGAKVYLDDYLQGDTSFFNSSYSIDGLLPGTYRITVQKDDYSIWQKTAVVEEGFVTDFSRIMLLPEEGSEEQELFDEVGILFQNLDPIASISLKPTPTPRRTPTASASPRATPILEPFLLDIYGNTLFENIDQNLTPLAQEVKGFRLSENENKIAWWTHNNELWVMWLNDTNYQPFYKKGDKELIAKFSLPIQDGAWFRDEDHIILELEQRDSKNRPYSIYRVIEIDTRGGINIVEL